MWEIKTFSLFSFKVIGVELYLLHMVFIFCIRLGCSFSAISFHSCKHCFATYLSGTFCKWIQNLIIAVFIANFICNPPSSFLAASFGHCLFTHKVNKARPIVIYWFRRYLIYLINQTVACCDLASLIVLLFSVFLSSLAKPQEQATKIPEVATKNVISNTGWRVSSIKNLRRFVHVVVFTNITNLLQREDIKKYLRWIFLQCIPSKLLCIWQTKLVYSVSPQRDTIRNDNNKYT